MLFIYRQLDRRAPHMQNWVRVKVQRPQGCATLSSAVHLWPKQTLSVNSCWRRGCTWLDECHSWTVLPLDYPLNLRGSSFGKPSFILQNWLNEMFLRTFSGKKQATRATFLTCWCWSEVSCPAGCPWFARIRCKWGVSNTLLPHEEASLHGFLHRQWMWI